MPTASYRCISADQALSLIFSAYEREQPCSVFDTRDAASYAQGHVPGAEPLAEREIGDWLRRLPRSQPLLIYCYHGNASQVFAKTFADFGFAEVYSIDGGFHALTHAWQRARQAAHDDQATAKPPLSEALQGFLSEQGFAGVGLDATIDNQTTALMKAAQLARLDVIDELVRLDASVDLRNADGNTALWFACFSNKAAIVKRLIGAGAVLDNQNDNGATCLMYAASSGKAAILKLLLDAGADAQLRNLDDFRAIDLASTIECLQLLRHTA